MLSASDAFTGLVILLGFGVLLYSGDCLVRGALAAGLKARISPLLVGILVVGFGTSLPEFLISLQAAKDGSFGLAHGNIVGSNIANIWLVVALPAIIFPVRTTAPRMRATALIMLGATAAFIGIAVLMGFNPAVGAAFLGALAVYVVLALLIARRDTEQETPDERKLERMHTWRMLTLILIGVVGLPLGAQLLVDGGLTFAKSYNLSQEVVGLTILALGSSLPELGAGIAAAARKESDVALGNILGANIFNTLGVGGVIALVGPQQFSPQFINYSFWAMGASTVMITFQIWAHRKIGWLTGLAYLAFYAAYIYGLIMNWSFLRPQCIFLECAAAH